MKKTILLMVILILTACSNSEKEFFTPVTRVIDKGFAFEAGDILVLNRQPDIYSGFGHSALVLEGGRVAEYPAYGYGYIEVGLSEWLEYSSYRQITVLRAHLSDRQKEMLTERAEEYSEGKYGVFNKKFGTEEFYCSSFIWRVYYDLGIDLDKKFKFLVLPYDFLKSKDLNKIRMQEN